MVSMVPGSEIVIPSVGIAELRPREYAQPGPGQVLVETDVSIVSAGTELTAFTQRFAPGTYWASYAKLPFRPGYSSVGTVVQVGEEVVDDLVGRRVLLDGPHASHHVVDSGLQAVPDSLPSEHAAWFALAQIAFRGFWRSDARVGDAIVVIGAGPIGQMVVRWASAAGVASTVVDPLAVRLEHARAGGASTVQASPLGDAAMESPDGPRPAIWIETTGNAEVFAEVLKRAPRFGRVVLLGDAGDPAQQHLTSDVLQKDLTIAGAFGAQTTADWPLQSVRQLFLDFAAAGRFPLAGLITDRFRPEECLVAYQRLVEDRASIMAGAFVWNSSTG